MAPAPRPPVPDPGVEVTLAAVAEELSDEVVLAESPVGEGARRVEVEVDPDSLPSGSVMKNLED